MRPRSNAGVRRAPPTKRRFARAAQLWRGFGEAAQASQPERFQFSTWRASRYASRRALLGRRSGAAAIAASYLVVRPPLGLWPSWGEMLADYRTEEGRAQDGRDQPREVSLELGTLTSVSVRATADHPTVDLIAGEVKSSLPTPNWPPWW